MGESDSDSTTPPPVMMPAQAPSTILAAPLQGYTDRPFRRAHALSIGGIDEYVTPFARIERNDFRKRDLKDLQPDRDLPAVTVPQILVKTPEETHKLGDLILQRGFRHLDINAGCPFPKVVDAGYGAAILQTPRMLEQILEAATELSPQLGLSIKLRLPTPADGIHLKILADILNAVPLRHVVLHPRQLLRPEQERPDMDAFLRFENLLRHPLFFNGDITALDSPRPSTQIMIGRGLLKDPLLPLELRGQTFTAGQRLRLLTDYHRALVTEIASSEQQPLPRLKTLWDYFLPQATGRRRKKVIKARSMDEYLPAVQELLLEL